MKKATIKTHTHIKKKKSSESNKHWQGCDEIGTLMPHWWECKRIQPLWKAVWQLIKKLKTELPYDSAIPLLGIDPKELKRES